jgi:small-conductance mechanosensitive channel
MSMAWYLYIASFFAGIFLANAIPHFVQGVSGNKFPTPFSKPPGRGLSSPTVNVLWALINFLVGYLLFRVGQVDSGNMFSLVIFFIGIAAISIFSGINFQKKERE